MYSGQRCMCRIIATGKKFDHITPILKDIGWLPVKEHLLFKDLVMIYKCINSLAPTYLCALFLKRKELNNRATRNNEALHIPLFSTTTGSARLTIWQKRHMPRAPRFWWPRAHSLLFFPNFLFPVSARGPCNYCASAGGGGEEPKSPKI